MLPFTDHTSSHQNRPIIGYRGDRRSILVVDDKRENCLVLQSMLEPLGFEIILAEDGEQEVEIAHSLATPPHHLPREGRQLHFLSKPPFRHHRILNLVQCEPGTKFSLRARFAAYLF